MTTYSAIAANKRKSIFLILIFIVLILAIGYLIQYIEGAGGYGIVFLAGFISIITALVGYFGGAAIALSTNSAIKIRKEDNPYVYRMVENLSIASGMPMPQVYLINDPAINAFATGRDPRHAHIAITTGAIEKLENEELEGVLAHEMSHVQNYDIRFLTLVAILVGTIVMLSDIFFRMRFFGMGGRGGGDSKNSGSIGAVIMLVGLVLLILSPIIAQLIKLAISRKREYLADASSSLLTRYPQGLIGALKKIAADDQRMRNVSNATAHLFIANPFGGKTKHGFASRIFSTHPPIEERIAALERMGGANSEEKGQ